MVYGLQINGFVFAPTTTTTTSSAATSTPTSTSATTTSPAGGNNGKSSGLSTGGKIGVGVGVSLGALGLISLLLAWFLIRRHRKKWQPDEPAMEHVGYTPELPTTGRFSRKPVGSARTSTRTSVPHTMSPPPSETLWGENPNTYDPAHDGTSPQHDGLHEMSATLKVPFSET